MMKGIKLGRLMVIMALISLVAVVALGPATVFAGQPTPPGLSEEGPPGLAHRFMDRDGNKIFDRLDKMVARAGAQETIPVIAVFDRPKTADQLRGALGAMKVNQTYENFPFLALDLTPGQIRALSKLPFVKQVEYDEPVSVCMGTASNWFGATKARADFGVTGDKDGNPSVYSKNDIVVAVIDTGIDPNHVDLDGGKIIAWKDYINNQASPYDDHGHGTHCAGIATGEGQGDSTYKGVAPGAALIGLKVLNSSGSGSTSNIEAAVDWCISNRVTYGIEVISMSLGSSGSSDGSDSLCQALNEAAAAGIVPVVAAGNSGPAKYTIGSPAAATDVITVGAMADCGEGGFSLAYFSSRGPTADGRTKPDIASPGVNIMAPKSGTTNQYVSMSGTSMATPFTAGTVALMLAANPSLTSAQIKTLIQNTAIDWCTAGKDIDFGSGRLDGYEAIRQAGSYSGTGPTVPQHQLKSDSLSAQNDYKTYDLVVTSTSYPIALTLIMTNWSSSSNPNFHLYLYNPSGTQVAKGETSTRQETIGYTPTVTGTYQVKVLSYAGSGPYTLDISAGLGAPPDNPPTVTVTDPIEGATVSGTYAVKVQASDDNGVSKVEVQIDTGTWTDITSTLSGGYYTYNWDTTGYADGAHSVTARATDTINQTATDTNGCTVNNAGPDTPPTVTVTDPTEGATVSGTYPVKVQASDDKGVSKVEVQIDTGSWTDITSTLSGGYYTYNWVTTAYPNGAHSVTARATDTISQTATDTNGCTVNNPSSTVHTLSLPGTVTSSQRDANFYFNVTSTGYIYSTLSWNTAADLDFYVYAPDGTLIGQAYTLKKPETLRTYTDTYGTGTYRIRVNLYSGVNTSFTLTVDGYEKKTWTGSVNLLTPDSWEYVPCDYTGTSLFRLSWPAGLDDLDFYVYDPTGTYRDRAYTIWNPETLWVTIDQTGTWQVKVNMYFGILVDYTLEVYVPEDNLSQ